MQFKFISLVCDLFESQTCAIVSDRQVHVMSHTLTLAHKHSPTAKIDISRRKRNFKNKHINLLKLNSDNDTMHCERGREKETGVKNQIHINYCRIDTHRIYLYVLIRMSDIMSTEIKHPLIYVYCVSFRV